MAKENVPESVRRWFRSIGAKGGAAGKGTEVRRELMRQNAFKRWAGHRKVKRAAAEKAQSRRILAPQPVYELPEIGFK